MKTLPDKCQGGPALLEKDKAGQPDDTHRRAPSSIHGLFRWRPRGPWFVVVHVVVAEPAAPIPGLPGGRKERHASHGGGPELVLDGVVDIRPPPEQAAGRRALFFLCGAGAVVEIGG